MYVQKHNANTTRYNTMCMVMLVIMCALCRIVRRVSGPQSAVQITGLIALKRSNERSRGSTAALPRTCQMLIYIKY